MTAARTAEPAPRSGPEVTAPLESSLEDLYELAPCGYLSTDPYGVVVKVNWTFLAWTGYDREQVVGVAFAELLTVGCRLFYDTRCVPVLRLQGQVREISLSLQLPDGRTLPVLMNANVHLGSDGQPRVVRVAVFDASGRQDYERELLMSRRAAERSEAQVRVLQQAASSFSAARTEDAITADLATMARSALDAVCSTVMLLDPAEGTLHASAEAPHPLGPSMSLTEIRPETEALRLGSVVMISSVDEAEKTFPALADRMYEARIEAIAATPLLDDEVPLGVLVCFFGRRRVWTDDEVDLQIALARQAAQALSRFRLQLQLQHLALHDKLTGLANRELLQYRLAQVLSSAGRSRQPLAVLFLDLDGFKFINDELGHAVGDRVLIETAQRLRDSVRDEDTVARLGGDEFIVVCENVSASAAVALAARVGAAIRAPIAGVPPGFPLTASIGVARHVPNGGKTLEPDAVVHAADEAMYAAKRGGKDRHTVIDV